MFRGGRNYGAARFVRVFCGVCFARHGSTSRVYDVFLQRGVVLVGCTGEYFFVFGGYVGFISTFDEVRVRFSVCVGVTCEGNM